LGRLYNWFFDASNGFLRIIVQMEKFFSRKRYSPVNLFEMRRFAGKTKRAARRPPFPN
jgi:hypothetical protein